MATEQRLHLIVRKRGNGDLITQSTLLSDPDDRAALQLELRRLLAGDGWDRGRFPEFDLEVRDQDQVLLTTVAGS